MPLVGLVGAVALHRLHVDAQLHRVAARARNRILLQTDLRERRASCDAQLRLDEIDAEDFFRDRVLDLQAGIRFDEREPLAGARVHQELEGARVLVTDLLRHLQSRLDQLLPRRVRERRTRRDLDDLLMTPLQAALALPQVGHRAAVADDLDLDVPRAREEFFDVDIAAAERGRRLGLAARVGVGQVGVVGDESHAAPAAAGAGLDHHLAARAERSQEEARVLERRRR